MRFRPCAGLAAGSVVAVWLAGCSPAFAPSTGARASGVAPAYRAATSAIGVATRPKGFAVVYALSGEPDGANPYGGVLADGTGDIFGATYAGGNGSGTVFELRHTGASFAETIVFAFSGANGALPYDSPIEDSNGNLYVTTSEGGPPGTNGVALELSPLPGGYEPTSSFGFPSFSGIGPTGPLLLLGSTLYATSNGGTYPGTGYLAALQLAGHSGGDVYDFTGKPDGSTPYAGLVADARGRLYGTTYQGGTGEGCPNTGSCGTVFRFNPADGVEHVLWNFRNGDRQGTDGLYPTGNLTFDAAGNIYGTTREGGIHGYGTIFKLIPNGEKYSEQILHAFSGSVDSGPDGGSPLAGLTLVGDTLYGTTQGGGAFTGGTIFRILTSGAGYGIVHNFRGSDGAQPQYGSLSYAGGALYGTTAFGGNQGPGCPSLGCGVVFRFVL